MIDSAKRPAATVAT
jgi:hypothetical protein